MNQINLVGRLGGDPEEKNGAVKFSIATNDGFGEKKKTNWHNIVAFGKTGEILGKYLKKGSQIAITGRIDYNKHNDKFYTSIIVDKFTFIGEGGNASMQEQEDDNTPF